MAKILIVICSLALKVLKNISLHCLLALKVLKNLLDPSQKDSHLTGFSESVSNTGKVLVIDSSEPCGLAHIRQNEPGSDYFVFLLNHGKAGIESLAATFNIATDTLTDLFEF
jgi:hypothetical protein